MNWILRYQTQIEDPSSTGSLIAATGLLWNSGGGGCSHAYHYVNLGGSENHGDWDEGNWQLFFSKNHSKTLQIIRQHK